MTLVYTRRKTVYSNFCHLYHSNTGMVCKIGPQFVFTIPGPQFVFTDPDPQMYLPALVPNLCLPVLQSV